MSIYLAPTIQEHLEVHWTSCGKSILRAPPTSLTSPAEMKECTPERERQAKSDHRWESYPDFNQKTEVPARIVDVSLHFCLAGVGWSMFFTLTRLWLRGTHLHQCLSKRGKNKATIKFSWIFPTLCKVLLLPPQKKSWKQKQVALTAWQRKDVWSIVLLKVICASASKQEENQGTWSIILHMIHWLWFVWYLLVSSPPFISLFCSYCFPWQPHVATWPHDLPRRALQRACSAATANPPQSGQCLGTAQQKQWHQLPHWMFTELGGLLPTGKYETNMSKFKSEWKF